MPDPSAHDPFAVRLTAAGMHALHAGDRGQGARLLLEAVQRNPCNTQAWLWLASAASSANEQRYCLEQVLALEPQHEAARRGLATCSHVVAVSPLPPPRAFSGATVKLQPLDRTAIKQPASQGASAPLVAPATNSAQQAAVTMIITQFGAQRNADDITRMLAEHYGYNWNDARALVRSVAATHRRAIAARQAPLLVLLGIGTLLAGIVFATLAVTAPETVAVFSTPRNRHPEGFFFVMGVMMVCSASYGIVRCLRAVW